MTIDWSFHAQDQLSGILRTIIYEPVDDQIRVLAILHGHQLITEPDTIWDR